MRVLVTGGAGRIGRVVVDRLAGKGFSVLVADQQPGVAIPDADYAEGDVLDYSAIRKLMRGCDAVVHLAAIASPGLVPNETLFNINVTGSYHVFQAAAELGIRRVVQASSINALGYYFGLREWKLQYLPVDEDHPTETTDPYSLSKGMIEEVGRYFWRREGVSSVALRLPAVLPASAHESGFAPWRQEIMDGIIARLLEMPPEARLAWLDEKRKAYDELRGRHGFEDPHLRKVLQQADSTLPADLRISMSGRYNLFAMIDERDAAQAVEKGLTVNFEGSFPIFVTDRVQWTGYDTNTLLGLFYPEVKTLKKTFSGRESLVSNERAKQLIGYEPEFSFE